MSTSRCRSLSELLPVAKGQSLAAVAAVAAVVTVAAVVAGGRPTTAALASAASFESRRAPRGGCHSAGRPVQTIRFHVCVCIQCCKLAGCLLSCRDGCSGGLWSARLCLVDARGATTACVGEISIDWGPIIHSSTRIHRSTPLNHKPNTRSVAKHCH